MTIPVEMEGGQPELQIVTWTAGPAHWPRTVTHLIEGQYGKTICRRSLPSGPVQSSYARAEEPYRARLYQPEYFAIGEEFAPYPTCQKCGDRLREVAA